MKRFLLLATILASSVAYAQQVEWAFKIGNTDFEAATAVTIDSEGNSYVVGSFRGTMDFDPTSNTLNKTSTGGYDVFVMKLNTEGKVLWVKTFSGINDEGAAEVTVDVDGNIYVAGNYIGGVDFDPSENVYSLSGYHDVFIAKLDPSGNFVWAKSVGGQYYDYAGGLATDPDGNVYLTGHFEGGGDFDPGVGEFNLYTSGGYGMFIMKLEADGNFAWAKMLHGGSDTYAEGNGLTVDDTGNSYSVGAFSNRADFDPGDGVYELQAIGGFDVFVLKLNTEGEFVWAKQMGGADDSYGASVSLDRDENVCIAGMFRGVCDFDPGNADKSLEAIGGLDVFIAKLDNDGNYGWAKSVGGNENESVSSIATDLVGNIFISGLFKGQVDFDPGPVILTKTANGTTDPDIFILELNAVGNLVSCQRFGGTGTDELKLSVDATGAIYGSGFFSGTIDLTSGQGQIVSSGNYDILILKMNSLITGVEQYLESGFSVYPNPSSDFITIRNDNPLFHKSCHVVIEDPLGRHEQRELVIYGNNSLLDVRELSPGFYFIRIDKMGRKVTRFVKK